MLNIPLAKRKSNLCSNSPCLKMLSLRTPSSLVVQPHHYPTPFLYFLNLMCVFVAKNPIQNRENDNATGLLSDVVLVSLLYNYSSSLQHNKTRMRLSVFCVSLISVPSFVFPQKRSPIEPTNSMISTSYVWSFSLCFPPDLNIFPSNGRHFTCCWLSFLFPTSVLEKLSSFRSINSVQLL